MGSTKATLTRLMIGAVLATSLAVGAAAPGGVQAKRSLQPVTLTEKGHLYLEPAPTINPAGINHVIGMGTVTGSNGIKGTDVQYRNEYPGGKNGCVVWQGGGTFTASNKVDGFEWVGTGTDCVTSPKPLKLAITGSVAVANGFGAYKGIVSTGTISGTGTLAPSAAGAPLDVPYTVTFDVSL